MPRPAAARAARRTASSVPLTAAALVMPSAISTTPGLQGQVQIGEAEDSSM
jgi:hypothetical protein